MPEEAKVAEPNWQAGIEAVDEIPVLLTSATRLGLVELVDQHLMLHSNWQGLSPGRVLTGWLADTQSVSEGDHRLNQAQDWAAVRWHMLQPVLGVELAGDRLQR